LAERYFSIGENQILVAGVGFLLIFWLDFLCVCCESVTMIYLMGAMIILFSFSWALHYARSVMGE